MEWTPEDFCKLALSIGLEKQKREWFKTHKQDEPLLYKEFIYESNYDLTPVEDKIQKKIKDKTLLGTIEGNVEMSLYDVSHIVTKFEKIDDKKYLIGIDVNSLHKGFVARQLINDNLLKIGIVGMGNDGKMTDFIRFDLIGKE